MCAPSDMNNTDIRPHTRYFSVCNKLSAGVHFRVQLPASHRSLSKSLQVSSPSWFRGFHFRPSFSTHWPKGNKWMLHNRFIFVQCILAQIAASTWYVHLRILNLVSHSPTFLTENLTLRALCTTAAFVIVVVKYSTPEPIDSRINHTLKMRTYINELPCNYFRLLDPRPPSATVCFRYIGHVLHPIWFPHFLHHQVNIALYVFLADSYRLAHSQGQVTTAH